MSKNIIQVHNFLKDIFRESLTSSDIQEIIQIGTFKQFSKGAIIFDGLTEPEWVGIVVSGSARGYYTEEEREVTGELYIAGDFVADYYGFLKREATGVSIQSFTEMEVFVWNREAYNKLKTTSIRTAQITCYFSDFAFLKVYEMAVSFLKMSPVERYNYLCINRPKIIDEIPEKYIANYIGIQPESLSRIKKRQNLT